MTEIALARGEVTLKGTATGSGPTVLLLHAGGEHRGVWAPLVAHLAEQGLRTVAYDQRGHRDSPGPATTLRGVRGGRRRDGPPEPAPVVMVGASLGGLAAVAALAEPQVARDVAGLVLVDVVPDPDPVRSPPGSTTAASAAAATAPGWRTTSSGVVPSSWPSPRRSSDRSCSCAAGLAHRSPTPTSSGSAPPSPRSRSAGCRPPVT